MKKNTSYNNLYKTTSSCFGSLLFVLLRLAKWVHFLQATDKTRYSLCCRLLKSSHKMERTKYIEFDIIDINKFSDSLKIYKPISESKKSDATKPDEFWHRPFLYYSLKHYFFVKTNVKPKFKTADFFRNLPFLFNDKTFYREL